MNGNLFEGLVAKGHVLFSCNREEIGQEIWEWFRDGRNDNAKLVELLLFLSVGDMIEGADYLNEGDRELYRAIVFVLTNQCSIITPGIVRGCRDNDQASMETLLRIIDEKISLGANCKELLWAESHVDFSNNAEDRLRKIREIIGA